MCLQINEYFMKKMTILMLQSQYKKESMAVFDAE